MTDEQVKKGLECCLQEDWGGCDECPYLNYEECDWKLRQDALALINRLEEENKELRALCRKKSNGMKLDEWAKMVVEADYGIKFADMNAIKEQIQKETATKILQDIDEETCGNVKFITDDLRIKYGVEVE